MPEIESLRKDGRIRLSYEYWLCGNVFVITGSTGKKISETYIQKQITFCRVYRAIRTFDFRRGNIELDVWQKKSGLGMENTMGKGSSWIIWNLDKSPDEIALFLIMLLGCSPYPSVNNSSQSGLLCLTLYGGYFEVERAVKLLQDMLYIFSGFSQLIPNKY